MSRQFCRRMEMDYFAFHVKAVGFLLTLPYLACHAKKYNSAASG